MARHVLLLLAATLAMPAAAGAEGRYVAVLTDGTRIDGNDLQGWASPYDAPKLDGKELAGSNRTLRWLRDQSLQAFEPGPDFAGMVEFAGGDRLPGRVVEFDEGEPDVQPRTPAHLVVAIEHPPTLANNAPVAANLRVLPRFIRRVVWGKTAVRSIEPGTLLFRDGRRISYQSLRWQRDAVRVLTEDGIREVTVAELAEVHLPRIDAWQSYCEELASLDPELKTRLVRLETARGLIVTTSESGLAQAGIGARQVQGCHMARPVWSLDPLWVPLATIRTRLSFLPNELPLSRWLPVRFVDRPMLGAGWFWQVDRNVEGGPLAGARQLHGWGLGVHAPCELWFEIPPCVEAFRTRAGLDRLAGSGGCARAAVYVNQPKGSPLFQSKPLIGSAEEVDTGKLSLVGPAEGQKHLILVADAMELSAPADADPLDIRDTLDWIEPLFLLDPARLRAEVQKLAPAVEKK